ncbi:MAG TPA: peptidylprolyl isomerase [Candidatus Deferrimicrobium sp.]|nr:peptidylprolyl isomerase [Candidatus Deferrimicrobium sp.]
MRKVLRTFVGVVVVGLLGTAGYYLYDNLRPVSKIDKLARIMHLEDQRLLSDRLRKFLRDEDPEVRARAALAIGRIGGKGSGELLVDMLGDNAMDVAVTAAFALGISGEKQFASRLLEAAFDLPSAITAEAVEAAGRLADSTMPEVADGLVKYLPHPSADVREAACLALFRSGAKAKGNDILVLVQNEPDELVRQAGLYALARLGNADAEKLYIEYLADSDPFLRSLAVRGLGSVSSPEAEHYVAIALNDADCGVVAEAIAQLAKRTNEEAMTQLAKRLERESNEQTVVALLGGLSRQKNPASVQTAEGILASQPPSGVAAAVVTYLASVQKDRAVVLLDSLVIAGDALVRAACAEAYGLVGGHSIVPRLAMLFTDEDPLVRRQALQALFTVDEGNADLYIRKSLADKDYTIVATAIDRIAAQKYRQYLPVMTTMMSRGSAIEVDVRRSLLEAATAFLKDDARDTAAAEIVRLGLRDGEYVVRRQAAIACRDLLGEDKFTSLTPSETRRTESDISSALKKYTRNPRATLVTEKGKVEMELYFDTAPMTVLNFIELARDGFYNGLTFHRLVPNFVVQGGDPRGDGWGGPPYYIRCEYSDEPFQRGAVGMATSGKDTGGSQFFVTLSPQPHLEGRYTLFGKVSDGMETVDRIAVGDVIESVVIHEEGL